MRRAALTAAMVLLAEALPARADLTPWWDNRWPYRRTIEVTLPAKPYPGNDVGVVDFLTQGQVQPDGRDIRVLGRGAVVPSKLVALGPGDRCLVAFELVPGVTTYHVYFGNAKAEVPKGGWEPQRGLILESWEWRGGGVDTFKQAQESIKSAQPKQGAAYVPQINHGWNPFGPSENYVHIYTGWLHCPEEGTYTFALSAEHAAFLFIDDRPVIQRGGWNAPTWEANIRAERALTRGLHRVTFYHIQGRGRWNTALVAWSLPSWRNADPRRQRYEVIPADAFAPVAPAKIIDLERGDQGLAPDFTAENVGKAWLTGDHYLIRYHFAAVLKPGQMYGARPTWDFGDQTTSTEAVTDHIYVNPGTYKVTLKIERNNNTYTAANALVVAQDWNRQTDQNIDPLGAHARQLALRDFSRLRPEDLNTLIDVFAKLRQNDLVARAGRILLLNMQGVQPGVLAEKTLLLTQVFLDQKRPDEAFRMLEAMEARVPGANFKAQLAVRAGELRQWQNRDLTGAAKDFTRALTQYATARDDAIRWATIRLADVHRRQGDRKKATDLYEKAVAIQPLRPQFDQSLVQPGAPRPVRVSSYARTVEAFLFEKKAEDAELLLNAWEWDYPDERLKGHSALLWVKLLLAKGDPRRAAEDAEDLAAFDDRNPYVPEALYLAGQACEQLKDRPKAIATYRRVVDDYPESPFVKEAGERLKALGTPAKTTRP